MNYFVTLGVLILLFLFGFLVGCFVCVSEINRLKNENTTLTEWLETARAVNKTLIKENTELLADLESAINGRSLFAENKEETK